MTRLPTIVRAARLSLLCLALMASSLSAHAEILISRPLLIDISNTYGFVTKQNHLMHEISEKHPSISRLALAAESEFSAKFKPAFDGMDFLIIQTQLMLHPEYKDYPAREFHDNYTYKYSADGSGKSKGVAFTIKSPRSWKAKECERPNIIQKFVSENGRGLEVFTILIAEIPFEPGQEITHEDIREVVRSREVMVFAPDNSTYIDSGEMVLENLPRFWLRYKMSAAHGH